MKKVIIGISGGVDSSVAALLLKKEGYEVIGVTFKMLEDFDPTDAIEVAKNLGIKLHIIDITKEFKAKIIEEFISNYKNGITPNPCVLCNKLIKFNLLYNELAKHNADYIATGHYAKIKNNKIYKSNDLKKDQSYFLCQINKDIIPKILFPLEGLTKEEIRKIAEENNLVTAKKKDSYDVCFIKDNFKDFLNNYIKKEKGKIINLDNNQTIGTHDGLSYYTIGQRKGLNLGGNDTRLFVAKKDIENNILYVASSESDNLLSNKAIIKNFNYLTDELYNECQCKFRYHQNDINCTVKYLDNNVVEVIYDSIPSVTTGQYCVLYKDDLCLGGGIIDEVSK